MIEQVIPASPTPASATYLLTAYFEPQIWTLTITAPTNGTIDGATSGQYQDGTTFLLSATPREGYVFDIWTINGSDDSANPYNLTMDKDYAVSVQFNAIPTYSIGGTVQNATGTPVAEVRVSAESTAYSTLTLGDGSFILAVPQGTYTLVFEKVAYNTVKVPNVSVTGNVQLIQPVIISPTPALGGFPWYVALIAVPVAAVIYWVRPKKRGAKK